MAGEFYTASDLLTLKSSGDMSSNQYKAVRASTTNADGGCTVVAARGGLATGVYLDDSTAATFGRVARSGIVKMLAGDSSAMDTAITQGLPVVASSQGQAVPSTAAGQHRIGYALDSLSTGSTGIIRVQVSLGITT